MSDTKTWPKYLAGDWLPGDLIRPILSPYDSREAGRITTTNDADTETAIASAHAAFAETAALPAWKKHDILRFVENALGEMREELARGITDESGKTIRDARTEVDRARLVFNLAAGEAQRTSGEVMPLDLNPASNNRLGLTRRFPAGVVGAITPFNFPLNLVAHKIAPAFAAGCPVVLKPAEKTPLTALRLAQIIQNSGWPRPAFSVLTPDTPQAVGAAFAQDERVAVLSFTGSDAVGWNLKAQASRKRVLLELGGNAAVIVHDDADLDCAALRCAGGAFANGGQVCISVQRILVQRNVWEPFLSRFLENVQALRLGDPHDENTDIGPLISSAACEKTEALINAALSGGATPLLAGERQKEAALFAPVVLTNTTPGMAVWADEAFAPVVCVEPYDTFREAISRVNKSRFGLQAGVFTQSNARIFLAWETLRVGGLIANDVPQYRVDNMPYGGEKDSGFGREGIKYAIEDMTELRLLALNFP